MDIKLIIFLVFSWIFGVAAFIGTMSEWFDNKKIKWALAVFSWLSFFGFLVYMIVATIVWEIKDDIKK